MPASSPPLPPLESAVLRQLGERLKVTRKSRGVSATALAAQVGISRSTLHAVESGDPSPTMGTYLRVLGALGVAGDIAMVGAQARARIQQPHGPQDLQSLLMHREAVSLIAADESLIQRALGTLERWKKTVDPRTLPLLDAWERILRERDWEAALQETERGNQLRQASPMATLLPDERRLRIIRQVKELKARHEAA